MEPKLTVRLASTVEDCRMVGEIDRLCFKEIIPRKSLRSYLSSPDEHLFVGVIDGVVIGYAVVTGLHSPTVDRICVVPSVGMSDGTYADMRRRGVGSAIIGSLQPRGGKITTHVHERDLDAQLFFRACGFTAVGCKRKSTGEHYTMVRGDGSPPAFGVLQGRNRITSYYAKQADMDCRVRSESPQRGS